MCKSNFNFACFDVEPKVFRFTRGTRLATGNDIKHLPASVFRRHAQRKFRRRHGRAFPHAAVAVPQTKPDTIWPPVGAGHFHVLHPRDHPQHLSLLHSCLLHLRRERVLHLERTIVVTSGYSRLHVGCLRLDWLFIIIDFGIAGPIAENSFPEDSGIEGPISATYFQNQVSQFRNIIQELWAPISETYFRDRNLSSPWYSLNFNPFPGMSMDFLEFQWISWNFHGVHGISQEFMELQWISIDFIEFRYISWNCHGPIAKKSFQSRGSKLEAPNMDSKIDNYTSTIPAHNSDIQC